MSENPVTLAPDNSTVTINAMTTGADAAVITSGSVFESALVAVVDNMQASIPLQIGLPSGGFADMELLATGVYSYTLSGGGVDEIFNIPVTYYSPLTGQLSLVVIENLAGNVLGVGENGNFRGYLDFNGPYIGDLSNSDFGGVFIAGIFEDTSINRAYFRLKTNANVGAAKLFESVIANGVTIPFEDFDATNYDGTSGDMEWSSTIGDWSLPAVGEVVNVTVEPTTTATGTADVAATSEAVATGESTVAEPLLRTITLAPNSSTLTINAMTSGVDEAVVTSGSVFDSVLVTVEDDMQASIPSQIPLSVGEAEMELLATGVYSYTLSGGGTNEVFDIPISYYSPLTGQMSLATITTIPVVESATGSALVVSNSTITSAGSKGALAAASLNATADTSAVGEGVLVLVATGAASVSSNSSMAFTGYKSAVAASSVNASTGIVATGSFDPAAAGEASVAAIASVSATGSAKVVGTAVVAAIANIAVVGIVEAVGSALITAASSVSAAGIVKVTSTAMVSADSSVGSVGSKQAKAISTVVAPSLLLTTTTAIHSGSALVSAVAKAAAEYFANIPIKVIARTRIVGSLSV